jgi:tetratricopeptide (TPR) repeat protein
LDIECSVSNLESIFQELETKLSSDDLLFIFATSHGDHEGGDTNDSYLILFDHERLWDDSLAEMIEDIECSQLIFPIYACKSGGFIDDLSLQTNKMKRTVITVVNWANSYYRDPKFRLEYKMDIFPYFLITAIRGYHPGAEPWQIGYQIGSHPGDDGVPPLIENSDFNPDLSGNQGNNDGTIQIGEVLFYTKYFDQQFSTRGQINYDCGFQEDLLSLTGISGKIEASQTIDGNFLIGGNLTISAGNTLTVANNSKLFFTNGDFTIAENSLLALGTNVTLKNYQDLCTVNVNGNLTVGNGGAFKSINESTLKNRLLNHSMQTNLNYITFENCEIHNATNSLTADHSVFTDCNMIYSYNGDVTIDYGTFTNSGLYLETANPETDAVSVDNCTFSTNQYLLGISLWNYDNLWVTNNTINGYYDGIQLMQTSANPYNKYLWGNTILNCTNAGIVTYNSEVSIIENYIHNNNDGIRLLNNSTVSIYGNPGAINETELNRIFDNDRYELYASSGSFPWYFRFNAIKDDNNTGNPIDPHIYSEPSGGMLNLDVSYNCWDDNFSASNDLYPTGGYTYLPEWCPPGSGHKSSELALQDFMDGITYLENEEYTDAKSTFETVIELYPETQYASAAMKELFGLEKFVDNDYSTLKQYFQTNDSIQADSVLAKLAIFLLNKCEIELENWQTAIDHFEDIIENPDSPQDSIFAIIDLGYTYFLMENCGQKSTAQGRLLQHKPESKTDFSDKRNALLALLPFKTKPQETETEFDFQTTGKLSQNIPNPFSGTTIVFYNLDKSADVIIKVTDHLGKTVKQLNFSSQQAGQNKVELNLNGLPSGIYFYSLFVNGQLSDTKKMVVY